jgi:Zn-dependent alcohol dehydrogenase
VEEVRAIAAGGVRWSFDSLYEYRARERPAPGVVERGGALLLAHPGSADEAAALEQLRAGGGYESAVPIDAGATFATLGAWTAGGKLNPTAIVTARYTLEAVNEALRDLENGDVAGQAIIVMEPLE